jgi:hypothetical protein
VTLDPKPIPEAVALYPLERMGVSELEPLRLLLRGGSVIDWRRLVFRTAGRWTASSA